MRIYHQPLALNRLPAIQASSGVAVRLLRWADESGLVQALKKSVPIRSFVLFGIALSYVTVVKQPVLACRAHRRARDFRVTFGDGDPWLTMTVRRCGTAYHDVPAIVIEHAL